MYKAWHRSMWVMIKTFHLNVTLIQIWHFVIIIITKIININKAPFGQFKFQTRNSVVTGFNFAQLTKLFERTVVALLLSPIHFLLEWNMLGPTYKTKKMEYKSTKHSYWNSISVWIKPQPLDQQEKKNLESISWIGITV